MSIEDVNKFENKRPGLFNALKAIFASDDEKISEDEMHEVAILNAESDKKIKNIENKIFAEKRKKLVENLKVVETTSIKEENENVKKIKSKEKTNDELEK